MKKLVLGLTLAGLVLTAAPAFAKDNGQNKGENHGLHLGNLFHFKHKIADKFIVSGVIKSIANGNVVITTTSGAKINVPNIVNNDATIKTDANTKVYTSSDKKTALALSALQVGQKVMATGSIVGSDALAKNVVIINSGVAVGKVTAKTDTSITITNGITSESKTIATDANTKIKIDGETKAVADIQVGDSGWVKFKTASSNLVAKIVHLFR